MTDGEGKICSEVALVASIPNQTKELDVLVLAAGFEDRAIHVLHNGKFSENAHCVIIKFVNDVVGNDKVFSKYLSEVRSKFSYSQIHIIELRKNSREQLELDMSNLISRLPRESRKFAVDISGMPSYAVCQILKAIRFDRSEDSVEILYSAAKTYNPSFKEYQELNQDNPVSIDLLPKSMALEMSENLVFDSFSGYRSASAKSFLVIFAGFEAHRSTGVVEAVNPSMLLLMYGSPGDPSLHWRLGLSKKLHYKFERGRRTANEEVSTLNINDSLVVLEEYYNFLIDDYDMVISPIGSKMQSVAAYLFWEKFGEVQLTFPIPIGYNPKHGPKGVAGTYSTIIAPRRPIFR